MSDSTTKPSDPHAAAARIQELHPNFKPKVGVVLGSGLGKFAEELENPVSIKYTDIPGFPETSVVGHDGLLTLGYCADNGVVCLQGRAHTYESLDNLTKVKTYVRALKLLGCQYFIATNASGSLREDVGPGELMLISDHINFLPSNPLIGPNDDEFGPRFFPLDNAYDSTMRENLIIIAQRNSIRLPQGVYLAALGPNYETAAEIRAFRHLGADAVGMSTVPEVLVANHCGMQVAVIATITNFATGLATSSHSHESVVQTAGKASEKLNVLLKQFISECL